VLYGKFSNDHVKCIKIIEWKLMNTILFAPWKTASTRLVKSLGASFDLVVKEVFHEDYYEADVSNGGLSADWFASVKSSPSWFKYVLDIDSCPMAKDWCCAMANDIISFSEKREGGVCFQVAESAQLAEYIFLEVQKRSTCDFTIFKSRYEPDLQCLSMIHNYLEGNPYFVANALIFFIINDKDISTDLRSAFQRLSGTGMVLLAQQMVGFFPLSYIVALSKFYCFSVSQSGLSDIDSVERFALPSYDAELMWDRYSFVCGEYFRSGSKRDISGLREAINSVEISKSAVSNLNVSKRVVGFSPKNLGLTTKLFPDRCFSSNLYPSPDGKLRPINRNDKSSQSTSVESGFFLNEVVLLKADGIREIVLMLDGVSINTEGRVHFQVGGGGCDEVHLVVLLPCKESIYIEFYCDEWPEIVLNLTKES